MESAVTSPLALPIFINLWIGAFEWGQEPAWVWSPILVSVQVDVSELSSNHRGYLCSRIPGKSVSADGRWYLLSAVNRPLTLGRQAVIRWSSMLLVIDGHITNCLGLWSYAQYCRETGTAVSPWNISYQPCLSININLHLSMCQF